MAGSRVTVSWPSLHPPRRPCGAGECHGTHVSVFHAGPLDRVNAQGQFTPHIAGTVFVLRTDVYSKRLLQRSSGRNPQSSIRMRTRHLGRHPSLADQVVDGIGDVDAASNRQELRQRGRQDCADHPGDGHGAGADRRCQAGAGGGRQLPLRSQTAGCSFWPPISRSTSRPRCVMSSSPLRNLSVFFNFIN